MVDNLNYGCTFNNGTNRKRVPPRRQWPTRLQKQAKQEAGQRKKSNRGLLTFDLMIYACVCVCTAYGSVRKLYLAWTGFYVLMNFILHGRQSTIRWLSLFSFFLFCTYFVASIAFAQVWVASKSSFKYIIIIYGQAGRQAFVFKRCVVSIRSFCSFFFITRVLNTSFSLHKLIFMSFTSSLIVRFSIYIFHRSND